MANLFKRMADIQKRTPTNLIEIEEENLRVLEVRIQQATLQRKLRTAKMKAFSDYVALGATTSAGLFSFGLGFLEIVTPEILPIVLVNPGAVLGLGTALILGDKAINVLRALTRN